MLKIINEYFKYVNAPHEITEFFVNAYNKIKESETASQSLQAILLEYDKNFNCNYANLDKEMDKISNSVSISTYTGNALKYILMLPSLKKHYEAQGLPLDILQETVKDVYYHIINCKLVKGVYGSFTNWHSYLWGLKVFGAERLQVWPMAADFDYDSETLKIKKGEPVFDLHIPRTETPLDNLSVEKSLKRIVEVFLKDKSLKTITFRCSSWLLYSKNFEILKEGSNILNFISRFTILENKEYPDYSELWRLFDVDYKGEIADLKGDTSLRRAYIKMIENGEKTGYGTGYFNYKL